MIGVLAISLLLFGLYSFARRNPRSNFYPSGPYKIPVFGDLLQLRKVDSGGLGKFFLDLGSQYGKIFSFDFANLRGIVITDYEMIKEAWANPDLCGRAKFGALKWRTGGQYRGIIFHDGFHWKEQRRFAIRHLKDFGFGREYLYDVVMREVTELVEGLEKETGRSISLSYRFNAAVVNSLWLITTGKRFSHQDKQLTDMVENIQRSFNTGSLKSMAMYIPLLIKLFPDLSGWTSLRNDLCMKYKYYLDYTQTLIDEYDGVAKCFAHVFIDEMNATTDPDSSFHISRGKKVFAAVLEDFFDAGAETTSSTLNWMCLYLSVFPRFQKYLQDEIDRVVGGNRLVTMEDRASMPYTQAILLETLRFSSIFPAGLLHRAVKDTQFRNFIIPKNTLVIANLYGVHFNPDSWTNPNAFNPERFLSEDKRTLVKQNAELLPFSVGKRRCIGEKLAMDQLFLFSVSIFQKFDVKLDPDKPEPSLAKQVMEIVPPYPYNVILTRRDVQG